MSPGIVSLLGFLIYASPAGEVEKTEADPPPQILAYLYWVPIYAVCEAAAARIRTRLFQKRIFVHTKSGDLEEKWCFMKLVLTSRGTLNLIMPSYTLSDSSDEMLVIYFRW